jgi:hypothetical protein
MVSYLHICCTDQYKTLSTDMARYLLMSYESQLKPISIYFLSYCIRWQHYIYIIGGSSSLEQNEQKSGNGMVSGMI